MIEDINVVTAIGSTFWVLSQILAVTGQPKAAYIGKLLGFLAANWGKAVNKDD